MMIKVMQININRSRRSLDLLLHQAKELGVGLLLVSEPCTIASTNNWFISQDGKSAIYVDLNFLKLRCRLAKQGSKFIAVYCGPYLIISTYISPSVSLWEYNEFLDDLSGTLSARVDKIIIAGDFNAKAYLWGSNFTNNRGLLVTRWAAERDLRIANMGNTPTCVRPQGSSIVDLTWSSPDLAPMIIEWKVMEDMESLSDHVGIRFDVCTGRPRLPIIKSRDRRWNLRKFDGDFFRATLIWGNKDLEAEDEQDLGSMIGKLDELMEEACDASAPRIGPRRPHRKAY